MLHTHWGSEDQESHSEFGEDKERRDHLAPGDETEGKSPVPQEVKTVTWEQVLTPKSRENARLPTAGAHMFTQLEVQPHGSPPTRE